jgi:3-methyladenine DNA glycosylase AlkC
MANKILQIEPDFNSKKFIRNIKTGVEGLELKDRVELIADQLAENLTENFGKNISLFLKIVGPENPNETGMFSNYYWLMPIAKYVEKYGINHFETSMTAIREITKRNTGEYTIRPFLRKYPAQTLEVMGNWSKDESFHVRRLSSEDGRPRLPWATKLQSFIDDPTPLLPILSNLKNDRSKYVQKSVANCINDILKDNFQIGKTLIEDWNKNPGLERKWIIKHALRNFVKQKNSWALQLIEND